MTQNAEQAERLENLRLLAGMVADRAEKDRSFRRAIGPLPEDLAFVAATLDGAPDSWRSHRAFHTVHVPSLIALMQMLDEIEGMSDVPEADLHDIHASVHRAAMLARDVRGQIEAARLDKAKIEARVLASYAPAPKVPLPKPSRWTRALDGLSATSGTVMEAAKSGVQGVADTVQGGFSGTIARAAAVPMLARSLQKSVTGAVSDTLARPITMRLRAGTRAIESGVGTGVGFGVIAGVLFPPLLPLTAGGAVLAAMRTWRSEMAAAQRLGAEEREARLAELRAERAAALAQLTQGAAALQMETEDLSMTLDVETGQADAVVLSGTHAGALWSSLSVAEKADAALSFTDGAAQIIEILSAAVTDG